MAIVIHDHLYASSSFDTPGDKLLLKFKAEKSSTKLPKIDSVRTVCEDASSCPGETVNDSTSCHTESKAENSLSTGNVKTIEVIIRDAIKTSKDEMKSPVVKVSQKVKASRKKNFDKVINTGTNSTIFNKSKSVYKMASKRPKKESPVNSKIKSENGETVTKKKKNSEIKSSNGEAVTTKKKSLKTSKPVYKMASKRPKKESPVNSKIKSENGETVTKKKKNSEIKSSNGEAVTTKKKNSKIKSSNGEAVTTKKKSLKTSKLIECSFCDDTFRNKIQLNHHVCKKYIKGKIFQCDVCDYDSLSKGAFRIHLRLHKDGFDYICSECKRIFKTEQERDLHTANNCNRLETKEATKQMCHICGCTVFSRLSSHIKSVHSDEPQYHCDICGLKMKFKGSLVRHRLYHYGNRRKFICEVCGCDFTTNSALKTHRLRVCNVDDCPYSCDLCGKKFLLEYKFRDHVLKYADKPDKCVKVENVCKVCNKRFSRVDALDEHMNVHVIEKPHSCDVCQKSFKRKDNMLLHKRSQHHHNADIRTDGKSHDCNIITDANHLHHCERKYPEMSDELRSPSSCSKMFKSSNHVNQFEIDAHSNDRLQHAIHVQSDEQETLVGPSQSVFTKHDLFNQSILTDTIIMETDNDEISVRSDYNSAVTQPDSLNMVVMQSGISDVITESQIETNFISEADEISCNLVLFNLENMSTSLSN